MSVVSGRRSGTVELWLVGVAFIANVASIATFLGISIHHKVIVVAGGAVSTTLWIIVAAVVFRQQQHLRDMQLDVHRVDHLSDCLGQLPFRQAKEIYCLASGTETYHMVLEPRLRQGLIPPGVTIHIGFRRGDGKSREAKLLEYDEKWKALAARYRLSIIFYPNDDFDHALRGIVIDDLAGAVGFYYRENGETLGGDSEVLLVNSSSALGVFLIRSFRRVFDCREPVDTLFAGSVRP